MTILVENDEYILDNGLHDSYTRAAVNDADLSFTLEDPDGNPVAGATAIEMAVQDTNGNYKGVLDGTLSLELNENYTLIVTSAVYNYQVEQIHKAVIRRR